MAKKEKTWKGTVNPYERFVPTVIKRNEIHGADYNPRKINETEKKKLKALLKEHGRVQPEVVNKRTMNIVGGHQRIDILDALIGKPDYSLTVAMIDVDEKEEAILNVTLNNPGTQGEWDTFKLQDLHTLFPDIDYVSDFGFDESAIDIMLGDIFKTEPEIPLIDPVKEAKSAEDFRQMKKDQREKAKAGNEENPKDVHELSDLDYTLTVVFPNNRDKADFMRKIRKDPKEKFVKSTVLFDIAKGVYDLSVLNKG